MGHGDDYWAARFPSVFDEDYIPWADCRVRGTTQNAPDELVSRLHLVAVTPESRIIVCRTVLEWRFLPGGTREIGETLVALARRELMEEAGAALRDEPRLFVSTIADSHRDRPYKPHQPHPQQYWAYAIARAEIVAAPTNPPDGEEVIEVLALPPAAAAEYLEVNDRVHADVVRLAEAMALL